MKVELELPPLPGSWQGVEVDVRYGVPSKHSLILVVDDTWVPWDVFRTASHIYAVRKWVPAIVTAGVLAPGWIVIDPDGKYWYSELKPEFDGMTNEWHTELDDLTRLWVNEDPQVTGPEAIWKIGGVGNA